MSKILILILAIITFGCSLSEDDLYKQWWKYRNGESFGDFIEFKNIKIINDTLYDNKTPFAILIKTEEGILGASNKIHLQSITNGKIGIYCGKGNL